MAETKKPTKTAKLAARAPKPAGKATAKPAAAAKPAATAKKAAAAKAAPVRAAAPAKRAVARPVTREIRRTEPTRPVEPRAPRVKPERRALPSAPEGHAAVIGADGSSSGSVALPESLSSAKRRSGVVFQAVLASRANARQANAATRNRTRVRGGGAKPYAQKGTGRARQGSIRAPHYRHGAVVFGPNGRRYAQRLPEKMRRLAFSEAFATRAAEGRILVFDAAPGNGNGDRLRTRDVASWLDRVGDTGSTLMITASLDETLGRALGNLPRVELRTPSTLRLDDLLSFDTLLVARPALDALASRAEVKP